MDGYGQYPQSWDYSGFYDGSGFQQFAPPPQDASFSDVIYQEYDESSYQGAEQTQESQRPLVGIPPMDPALDDYMDSVLRASNIPNTPDRSIHEVQHRAGLHSPHSAPHSQGLPLSSSDGPRGAPQLTGNAPISPSASTASKRKHEDDGTSDARDQAPPQHPASEAAAAGPGAKRARTGKGSGPDASSQTENTPRANAPSSETPSVPKPKPRKSKEASGKDVPQPAAPAQNADEEDGPVDPDQKGADDLAGKHWTPQERTALLTGLFNADGAGAQFVVNNKVTDKAFKKISADKDTFDGRRSASSCKGQYRVLKQTFDKVCDVLQCTGGGGDADENASHEERMEALQAKMDYLSRTQSIDFKTITPEVIHHWETSGWYQLMSVGLGKQITVKRPRERHSGAISDLEDALDKDDEDTSEGDNVGQPSDERPAAPAARGTASSNAIGYQPLNVPPHQGGPTKSAKGAAATMLQTGGSTSAFVDVIRESMMRRDEHYALMAKQKEADRVRAERREKYKECKDLLKEADECPGVYAPEVLDKARDFIKNYLTL